MATYKLTYFNIKGRAELIRWIFVEAGVQYEDYRMADDEWPKLKPKTPFNAFPTLEVDGKMLGGSVPIARYLAEKYGLAGSNDLENAELAGIADMLNDMTSVIYDLIQAKNEAVKAETKKDLLEKTFPNNLGVLQARITANGCPEGWIFGSKMTYADIYVALTVDVVKLIDENAFNAYPAILKLRAAVEAQPKIAKWIKDRPQTQF